MRERLAKLKDIKVAPAESAASASAGTSGERLGAAWCAATLRTTWIPN
jgi:hypothetical protein